MRRSALLAVVALLSCAAPRTRTASVDPRADARAADRAALLRLHERQRTAHLERRADWLVGEYADSVFSVSDGRVSLGRRGRGQARWQAYLDSSDFEAWDDIVPPRIRISDDGTLAYVVVEKRVHSTTRDATGATTTERTRYAWLSVYEKQAGEWRLAAIASTDRPDTP